MEHEHSHDHEHSDEAVHETPVHNNHKTKPRAVFIKGAVSAVVGIVAVVVVVGVVTAYRAPDAFTFFPRALAAMHAPAATVDGSIISWHDLAVDSDALSLYLSKSGAPKTDYSGDTFRTRVMHRQMLTIASEKLAEKLGVTVSDEQLNKELEDISAAGGGKEKVAAEIKTNFGWTYEQYRDHVVRSMLILQELQKKLLSDDSFIAPARTKAEAALAEVKSGKDFAAVAKEVSQDSSAAQGGDLGFMKPGQTVPEFDAALFSMKKGQVSDLIKTEFGYHIIKVEEVKKDRAGKTTEVRARHILLKYPSVVLYVQQWLDSASIHQFMHTTIPARIDSSAGAAQ